jgi:hypothetical protein
MKTIKFEDALKDYLEEMKRTGWYTKAYKAFVEANILKLVMERRPVADPNATMMDLFDATEMTEIVREAEAMTEAFMKSEIERMARELGLGGQGHRHRLLSAARQSSSLRQLSINYP